MWKTPVHIILLYTDDTHRHLWRSSDCYERFFRNIISNGGNAWRYIRNRKLKKGRQYKDWMKRDKKTNHTITAHTQLKTEKHETRCKYLPKKTEKHETRCKYLPKKTEKTKLGVNISPKRQRNTKLGVNISPKRPRKRN